MTFRAGYIVGKGAAGGGKKPGRGLAPAYCWLPRQIWSELEDAANLYFRELYVVLFRADLLVSYITSAGRSRMASTPSSPWLPAQGRGVRHGCPRKGL